MNAIEIRGLEKSFPHFKLGPLDVTIPDYLAKLGQVAVTLAEGVNGLHRSGFDAAGDPGTDVFTYDPTDLQRALEPSAPVQGETIAHTETPRA